MGFNISKCDFGYITQYQQRILRKLIISKDYVENLNTHQMLKQ